MNENTEGLRICSCGGWCGPSQASREAHRTVFGHRFIEKKQPARGGEDGQEHPDPHESAPPDQRA